MNAVVGLACFTFLLTPSLPAVAAESCKKDCRDFRVVCQKAHSQAACKTDYDICVKQCDKK